MSQNPDMGNSGYGTDPQNPYGAPQPQNPYGVPPQDPYSQPPPNPYDPSQGQYGTPQPQNPYEPSQGQYSAPPPQNPYGAPPQNPYGQPPQGGPYGAPGYTPPWAAAEPVQYTPLPLNDAIRQLPNQYIKVLTKPSAATFAEELPKAGWDITWVQLVIVAVAVAVLGLIAALILTSTMRTTMPTMPGNSAAFATLTTGATVGGAISNIILVPLAFFFIMGIQFGMAKLFKGQGTFLGQCYTALLYQVPVQIIGLLIRVLFSLIPIAGPIIAGIIGLALGIYSIVLNVFQIQAAHRLSGGKAVGVVLIPIAALIVLALLCGLAFAGLIYGIIRSTQPHP